MKVIKATTAKEVESIRPLANEWKEFCSCDKFGLETDISIFLAGLMNLIDGENSDLLLLMDSDKIVGLMGITKFQSPFGQEQVANEHYMFVSKGNSVIGGKRLIDAAREWAKCKGCSHLIMNASNAASDLHDKVCKFYERLGLTKFETSFISEV